MPAAGNEMRSCRDYLVSIHTALSTRVVIIGMWSISWGVLWENEVQMINFGLYFKTEIQEIPKVKL